MKNSLSLLFVFVVGALLSGCTGYTWVQTRDGLALRPPSASPMAPLAGRGGVQEHAPTQIVVRRNTKIDEAFMEGFKLRSPVLFRRYTKLEALRAAACQPLQKLRFKNRNYAFAEVRSRRIVPCSSEGLRAVEVLQRNGGMRIAIVIPPHGTADYGFLPDDQFRGEERYDVEFYAPATIPAKWLASFTRRPVPIGDQCSDGRTDCIEQDRNISPRRLNRCKHKVCVWSS